MPFWVRSTLVACYQRDARMHLGSQFQREADGYELELTVTLDDDAINNLCCQFPISADYDGYGSRDSKFAFYL